jgi:hypothetical protein
MKDKVRFSVEPDGTLRDRYASPSINFPRTEEEAFQALLHSARKALIGEDALRAVLSRTYTTDAGLGTTRSQQQADWLNHQQSLIRARIEDLLDELDLEHRLADVSH